MKCFFFRNTKVSLPVSGLFSLSRLRVTQGAHLYTTVQVWVQAGLHAACSGRSKSRNLASNLGVSFRGARAKQGNGKPTYLVSAFFQVFCSAAAVEPRSHGATLASRFPGCYSHGHFSSVCGHCLCVCVLRVRVCASVRGSVYVCAGTWKSFLWCGFSVLVLTRKCKYCTKN